MVDASPFGRAPRSISHFSPGLLSEYAKKKARQAFLTSISVSQIFHLSHLCRLSPYFSSFAVLLDFLKPKMCYMVTMRQAGWLTRYIYIYEQRHF